MRILAISAAFMLCVASKSQAEMLDLTKFRAEFQESLARVNEKIQSHPTPKYMIYKVIINHSLQKNIEIRGKIDLPVWILNVTTSGEYNSIYTTKQTFEYVPSNFIKRSSDYNKDLLEYIDNLNASISELKKINMMIPKAIYEEDFIIYANASGSFSFKNPSSIGIDGKYKNIQHAKYFFCLTEDMLTCSVSQERCE